MAGLPSVEGLAGASIDEGSTPPWLWRLIARMAMPRQEPVPAKGPPGSSPETAIQLPPIYATAPAASPGTYAGADLAAVLASPLFTDTLSKVFGAIPRVEAMPDPQPTEVGHADRDAQGRPIIRINQSNYRGQGYPLDILMAHEYTHTRDIEQDPGITAIEGAMKKEFQRIDAMDLGPTWMGDMIDFGKPGTTDYRTKYAKFNPMEHIAVSVEQAIELMRNKATPEQIAEMDELLPGTKVMYDHIQKSLGPAARDATATPPQKSKGRGEEEAPAPRQDTISAVDRDWFDEMKWKVENWQLDRGIKPLKDTVFGKAIAAIGDPLGAIGPGGPAAAIATWGSRSERVRDIFANPSFHNWIIKNATKKNLRGNFSQIRDNAPEEVIEQLYQEFLTSRKAPHGGGGGHGLIRTTK
jgi:hypothetical protein